MRPPLGAEAAAPAPKHAGSAWCSCVRGCESADAAALRATRDGLRALLPATQRRAPFCRPLGTGGSQARTWLWFADPCSAPKRVTLKRVSRIVNLGPFGCPKCLRVLRSSGVGAARTRRAGDRLLSVHRPRTAAVSPERNSAASSAVSVICGVRVNITR